MKLYLSALAIGVTLAQPSHAFLGNLQAIAQEKIKEAAKDVISDVATEVATEEVKKQGYTIDPNSLNTTAAQTASAKELATNAQGMKVLTNAAASDDPMTKASATLSLVSMGLSAKKAANEAAKTTETDSE